MAEHPRCTVCRHQIPAAVEHCPACKSTARTERVLQDEELEQEASPQAPAASFKEKLRPWLPLILGIVIVGSFTTFGIQLINEFKPRLVRSKETVDVIPENLVMNLLPAKNIAPVKKQGERDLTTPTQAQSDPKANARFIKGLKISEEAGNEMIGEETEASKIALVIATGADGIRFQSTKDVDPALVERAEACAKAILEVSDLFYKLSERPDTTQAMDEFRKAFLKARREKIALPLTTATRYLRDEVKLSGTTNEIIEDLDQAALKWGGVYALYAGEALEVTRHDVARQKVLRKP